MIRILWVNYQKEDNLPKGKSPRRKLNKELNSFEFAVSDSAPLPEDSIKAIDTKRLHLKTGRLIIPQTWEAIKENCSATITISSIKANKNKLLSWSEICKTINSYTQNSNDIEWEILKIVVWKMII